jgi:hypothetical protein
LYYRVSPAIAELMRSDPKVKRLARWLVVSPIVQHLKLASRFPDAPIGSVEEPWRSFLLETRNELEAWGRDTEMSEPPLMFCPPGGLWIRKRRKDYERIDRNFDISPRLNRMSQPHVLRRTVPVRCNTM